MKFAFIATLLLCLIPFGTWAQSIETLCINGREDITEFHEFASTRCPDLTDVQYCVLILEEERPELNLQKLGQDYLNKMRPQCDNHCKNGDANACFIMSMSYAAQANMSIYTGNQSIEQLREWFENAHDYAKSACELGLGEGCASEKDLANDLTYFDSE